MDDPSLPLAAASPAETVLHDVRVIAIDQQLVQGARPAPPTRKPARTVTLEVTPDAGRARLGRHPAGPAVAGGALRRRQGAGADRRCQHRCPPAGVTWGGDVSPALRDDAAIDGADRARVPGHG